MAAAISPVFKTPRDAGGREGNEAMETRPDWITVVSGLPRSGTSMMMKMLEAGGMEILTDHERKADTDNPKGYYEFERVKKLPEDTAWLPEAVGKAVKVIARLLRDVPEGCRCRVLFLHRDLREVIASQNAMLTRRGKSVNPADDEAMMRIFHKHLRETILWMEERPEIAFIEMQHREMVENPAVAAARIRDFLELPLDTAAMAAVVDPRLHRQKR
jgi:hypothetical protein